jgi:hypothetical protein
MGSSGVGSCGWRGGATWASEIGKFVQVLLDVGVAIAAVAAAVAGTVWVQPVCGFPGIGHAVAVGVEARGPSYLCHGWLTAHIAFVGDDGPLCSERGKLGDKSQLDCIPMLTGPGLGHDARIGILCA